ncbi:hypothetical protein BM536_003785 [Streptomyces phaeoluteigriseus]|uniref:Uncharacterized protein n=1 Tax=Streptomyces phaeoluteigriseus TaxID=114686 RepID=A0A1V6MXZ4_9ACTN|nr:hypothetical protein [Streptomyces phaeoluteigriseus]OQD57163.1 hypothetical protein BM536_003785 [Streptomyces phaeoluteigriseus]
MVNDERPDPATGLNVSMSRADMVAAWREQRRARRPRSDADEPRTAGPDGFALRRWRRAGVFGADAVRRVERLLTALRDARSAAGTAPDWAVQTLDQCLGGDPVAQLPSAVRAVLEHGAPGDVVTAMAVVHEAGLPWLTPEGQARLEHLMDPESTEIPREFLPALAEDVSGAFAAQYALRHDDVARLSPAVRDRVLPWAPVGVVDDLIDAGAITSDDEPWNLRSDAREQDYLRARLAPEQVDQATAEAIGWQEYLRRRRLLDGEDVDDVGDDVGDERPGRAEKSETADLSGEDAEDGEDGDGAEDDLYGLLQRAAEGDTSAVKGLEYALPRYLVLRLRQVRDGALTGNWPADILADRGLWRLMSALWEPKAAVSPRRSPFHAMVALRHAYDSLCAGDLKRARAQVELLVEHEQGEPRHNAEAWNMSAYLALLDENLDGALVALHNVDESHPAAELARHNRHLLEGRRTRARNDRTHPSNPYLELGLPHRSPVWKQRYRDLRREFADDREEAARLNRAMRRIQQAEQHEDWSDFFVLPLDAEAFRLPDDPPTTLVPPVEPLPRRTAPQSSDDLEIVRRRALAELLPTFVNAPRRPDHQHRTTS